MRRGSVVGRHVTSRLSRGNSTLRLSCSLLCFLAATTVSGCRLNGESISGLREHVGQRPVKSTQGNLIQLLPVDSQVAVVFVRPECGSCRLDAPDYVRMSAGFAKQGVAFRVVILGLPEASTQYARLLHGLVATVADSNGAIASRFGLTVVPSLYILPVLGNARRIAPFVLPKYSPGAISVIVNSKK